MSRFLRTLLANELTLKHQLGSNEKLNDSIRSANIDLNPHQVEAAIFAFKSPLSRGAILADEVGLGKTIEAGLIINQLWAEGRRRILILAPASLRTQWQDELVNRFYLDSLVIDGPSFKKLIKARQKTNPINQEGIYIASHNFAYHYDVACKEGDWDLVVIDEAHRMRNVYRKGNKVAKKIKAAFDGRPKILLTATPLQNNLMELFGLVSFLDERYLGTDYSFRNLYVKSSRVNTAQKDSLEDLRKRLMGEFINEKQEGGVLVRSLRSQVQSQGLVQFTNRYCITEDFDPNDDEIALYDSVSEYLRRPVLASTLATQRNMMELVYRKILASSSFAIAGTLYNVANFIAKRLQQERGTTLNELVAIVEDEKSNFKNKWNRDAAHINISVWESREPELQAELPGFDDIEKELHDFEEEEADSDDLDEDELETKKDAAKKEVPAMTKEDMIEEFKDVLKYYFLAKSIKQNQKSQALVGSIKKVFDHAEKMEWPQKAVVFTESRRTQDHLETLLKSHGYNVVLFNGSNASKEARGVFEKWAENFPNEASAGSRSINVRKALVWHFQQLERAILITTEAGAEGLNLQFANIVVNYDLPWNPQRVEQRIGRCHRYGQGLDVLVINFLNRKNYADARVYELLKEKIRLFGNLFDFSDTILGTEQKLDDGYHVRELTLGGLGSGVDFEKRVLKIYRECRTPKEIEKSFKAMQTELFEFIEQKVEDTQRKVIQNFDEEVQKKLRLRKKILDETLKKYDRKLLRYIRITLENNIRFRDDRTFLYRNRLYKLGSISTEEREQGQVERAHSGQDFLASLLEEDRDKDVSISIVLKHPKDRRKFLEDLIGKECQLNVERIKISRKTATNKEEEFEELIYSLIVKQEAGWKAYGSKAIELIAEMEVVKEDGMRERLHDQMTDLILKQRAQREKEKVEENLIYIDKERDQMRRFAKEALLRHEADMQKIKSEIEKLENSLTGSRTLGFHERQEIQDQISKMQRDYLKAQETYFKAEREQFNLQDQMINQLKQRMNLEFEHKHAISAKVIIKS